MVVGHVYIYLEAGGDGAIAFQLFHKISLRARPSKIIAQLLHVKELEITGMWTALQSALSF